MKTSRNDLIYAFLMQAERGATPQEIAAALAMPLEEVQEGIEELRHEDERSRLIVPCGRGRFTPYATTPSEARALTTLANEPKETWEIFGLLREG